jgi:molybdopterin/thiamine biosynthesis adenylyltransferase
VESDQPEKPAGEEGEDVEIVGLENINQDLFDRQKRLKGWDQEKIRASTVLVVGAGATGNELVKNLVLMGLGKIFLVDFDIIERSNLNRCVFFKESDAVDQRFKAEIVAQNASEFGRTEVVPLVQRIEEVDESIYNECSVAASCLDNMEARLQLNSYAFFHGIPFVDSGIDGFNGTIFCTIPQDPESPCLQCSMSSKDLENMWRKFSCTGQEIEKSEGFTEMKMANIITTTSIIGALQAQQVIKILLGLDTFMQTGSWTNESVGAPIYKRELRYDGIRNEFVFIEKMKNPSCWVCSYQK